MLYVLNLIFAFLILPAFGMKIENQEQEVPEIPHAVFENEILLRAFTNLIKECVSSEETDNIKSFLEKVNNLFVNKKAMAFLRKYIPAKKDNDMRHLPFTPLLVFAIKQNNMPLFELILQHAKPTQKNIYLAFCFAIQNKYATQNHKFANMLLKYGTNYNNVSNLIHAAFGVEPEILMSHGIPENINNFLYNASDQGNVDVSKYLLLNNIDVNTHDDIHYAPIIWAAANQHEELIKLLLLHPKIDVSITEKDKWTALMWAAIRGNEKTIKLLLFKSTPDIINAQNLNGQTALHWAVAKGHKNIVELLLKNGADYAIKNCQGDTALDTARDCNDQEIIKILET